MMGAVQAIIRIQILQCVGGSHTWPGHTGKSRENKQLDLNIVTTPDDWHVILNQLRRSPQSCNPQHLPAVGLAAQCLGTSAARANATHLCGHSSRRWGDIVIAVDTANPRCTAKPRIAGTMNYSDQYPST